MEYAIISVVSLICGSVVIQGVPIKDGYSVKFSPLSVKEEIKPKQMGGLFAKIPQEFTSDAERRRASITKLNPEHNLNVLGAGCSNQVARIVFPLKNFYRDFNDSETWGSASFVNLPIIQQPFKDYKILVATAPPHLRLQGDGDKPVVVYVVFTEDSATDESGSLSIPSVYFVNKPKGWNVGNAEKVEPVLVIDSNRTVTGIKSRNIEKFVKFQSRSSSSKTGGFKRVTDESFYLYNV